MGIRIRLLAFVCVLLAASSLADRGNAQLNLTGATEVQFALDKLNVLASVLMIAAHPDDEANAVVAYFGRGRKASMAYLSATRGEGGQNLLGSEQGELLGLIRTQELLAARRVDDGEQYFTRAIDFGFSKTAAETLKKWDHDAVLSDMVWVIRKLQPDVVIFQFSGTPSDGHGHHQASGILGREAVPAAADPTRFPEQLKWVKPWKVKRAYSRAGGFGGFGFAGNFAPGGAAATAVDVTRPAPAPVAPPPPTPVPAGAGQGGGRRRGGGGGPGQQAARAPGQIDFNTGEYDPVLGKSYSEIGVISRVQHQSQGQGGAQRKGAATGSLAPVAIGKNPPDTSPKDVFEGIDITWHRVLGGDEIGKTLADATAHFEVAHPERTVPKLLATRPAIAKLAAAGDVWGVRKLKDLDRAVALCAGLWLDAEADRAEQTPGGTWKISATAVSRLHLDVGPVTVAVSGLGKEAKDTIADKLPDNRLATKTIDLAVPKDAPYSQPFWLVHERKGDTYDIRDQQLIGRADTVPVLEARFTARIGGETIEVTQPVRYRYVDQKEGEKTKPLVLAPPVTVNLANPVVVFPGPGVKTLSVSVQSQAGKVAGKLRVEVPAGWHVEPASRDLQFAANAEEQEFTFQITPPANAKPGNFRAIANIDGRDISTGMRVIAYSHIPPQTVFPPAEGKLVPAPLILLSKHVGYVMGAGDDVPDGIRQMGAEVELLSDTDLAERDLSKFDVIVTGVRAYDVRDALRANQPRLLRYVEGGGTLVVQYNRGQAAAGRMGPYPITIGGNAERVTVEDAAVTFLKPESVLLRAPNAITQADFAGWIQERGAYFPSKWDDKYEAILECHDPGEKPLTSGMLFARYGKGAYVFTGYAWFRQLPAGVPGAYRIFANLLSAGKVR